MNSEAKRKIEITHVDCSNIGIGREIRNINTNFLIFSPVSHSNHI